MEFSKSVRVVLLLAVYLFALANADINEVKKNAIKKLETHAANTKKLYETTITYVEKRKEMLPFIVNHWKEFGEGINKDIIFKVKGLAKSANMLAELMKSPADVVKCIQTREKEGLDEIQQYYNNKFLKEWTLKKGSSERYQNEVIKNWRAQYERAAGHYFSNQKKYISDIQQATSESAVNKLVAEFDDITERMASVINEIHKDLAKVHLNLLSASKSYVTLLKDIDSATMFKTSKNIDKCFSKF